MTAKNVYEQRVKDVMSRDLVTIDANESIHDALQLMAENKVAALPVVDRHGRCVGMISASDLVEVTRDLEAGLDELEQTDELFFAMVIDKLGNGIGHQTVLDLMSEDVISANPEERLTEAASRILRDRVHRLPVVDDNDHLIGIISTTDILAAFVESSGSYSAP